MKELIVLSSINRALVDSGEMQRQGILVDFSREIPSHN